MNNYNSVSNDVIEDNIKFPYLYMTLEEKDFYLNEIVKKCKDICNTENIVSNKRECEILRMSFKKENNVIYIDGYLTIGDDKSHENRYVTGSISVKQDLIVSIMNITRLCVDDKKEYTVIDKFKFENGKASNVESNYFYKESKRKRL